MINEKPNELEKDTPQFEEKDTPQFEEKDEITKSSKAINIEKPIEKKSEAKWINNEGKEVENVFGFTENAELVNARAAMVGFLMLVITELIFKGQPVTHTIFGIN